MKTIQIKEITLTNFKGLTHTTITFHQEAVTTIHGDNATGKSTIFDAFSWALFGKDSHGTTDFSIKTINPDGTPLTKAEHSVALTLLIDGKEKNFRRQYKEKWVKTNGSEEETFKGHETLFFIDNLPVATKKEYDQEVNSIIPEALFRAITNPFYFTSLKGEEQKSILYQLAGGELSLQEIAEGQKELQELLLRIGSDNLDTYKRRHKALLRDLTKENADLPTRIETAQTLIPPTHDWDTLTKEQEDITAHIQTKEQTLASITAQEQEAGQKERQYQQSIDALKLSIQKRKAAIEQEANATLGNLTLNITRLENEGKAKDLAILLSRNKITDTTNTIQTIETTLQDLRAKATEIYNRPTAATLDQDALYCPTCGQELPKEQIQQKLLELSERANTAKARELTAVETQGQKLAKDKADHQVLLQDLQNKLQEQEQALIGINTEIATLQAQREHTQPANIDTLIANDQELITLQAQLTKLTAQPPEHTPSAHTEGTLQELATLRTQLREVQDKLALKDEHLRVTQQIDTYRTRLRHVQIELARIESEITLCDTLQKRKDELQTQAINALFHYVQWSFLSEQVNGGERITTTLLIKGVPYPDANDASKLNAGLDIINALCTANNTSAPIFIDNAERSNYILPTIGQQIHLIVSKDKQLVIK